MSGGEKNETNNPEISDQDRLIFERLDFDAAFSLMQRKLHPILDASITQQVGLTELIIHNNSLAESLPEGTAYHEVLQHTVMEDSGDENRVLIVVNPGGEAIYRYWDAIDMHLTEATPESRDLSSQAKTIAHEMYICGLLTSSFLLAAEKEAGKWEDGEFPRIQEFLSYLNTLLGSEQPRGAVRDSDYVYKNEVLELMDYLVPDLSKSMRLNLHRFAAGLYFEIYKEKDQRIKSVVTEAMREDISLLLAKDKLDDATFEEKLSIFSPTSRDIRYAAAHSVDQELLKRMEQFNISRAEKIPLDQLGWAFPMERPELARLLAEYYKS